MNQKKVKLNLETLEAVVKTVLEKGISSQDVMTTVKTAIWESKQ